MTRLFRAFLVLELEKYKPLKTTCFSVETTQVHTFELIFFFHENYIILIGVVRLKISEYADDTMKLN